ncbi:venom protease-like [Daktulosphaira vitifoliae]|uniref:venom protease-like n=1 Tax=Daktulosphaira vitifoliae TaxID=58002 RepID=UPI0021AA77ED|nr:venom protease-like [Daktulosphaira vitifoliae]
MKHLRFLLFLLFVFKSITGQLNNGGCINPYNENGQCINIKKCSLLKDMLTNNRRNASVINFLRDSVCGYERRDPKVCCPLRTVETYTASSTKPDISSNYETVSSSKLPPKNSCGYINATLGTKIVGGQPAELGAWPWIAAIGYSSLNIPKKPPQWLCGGTLISDKYVVTAAHCTVGLGSKKISIVRLGDLILDSDIDDGANPIDIPVEKVMIHENYNSRDVTNDIAILKLKHSVSFNHLIQPACLPIMSDIRANKFVKYVPKVAGWGAKSFRGPTSSVLLEAPVPVVDNAECKRSYVNEKTLIDERSLCAGYKTGGIDACQGDSGGPLITSVKAQHYLIGVVSYGVKCAEPNYPGVYSRVTYFVDWIVEKMNNS